MQFGGQTLTANIVTMAVLGAIVMYLISMAALFRLRRTEPALPRTYRAPFYPVFPAIALGLGLVCLGAMVWFNADAHPAVPRADGAGLRLLPADLGAAQRRPRPTRCCSAPTSARQPERTMRYRTTIAGQVFAFDDLRQVMAVASPARSGDYLAGIGAATAQQRMAARHVLADTPLTQFLTESADPLRPAAAAPPG